VPQENHAYFRDRLSAYYDNELSPQEREAVKKHLGQCQECRDLLAKLQRLDRLVQQHAHFAESDYWEQSARRIEQRLGFSTKTKATDITPSKWRNLVSKIAAVAASAAILGFIALYEKEISPRTETAPSVAAPSVPVTPTEPPVQEKIVPADKGVAESEPAAARETASGATTGKEKVSAKQKSPSESKAPGTGMDIRVRAESDKADKPVTSSRATTPVVVRAKRSPIKKFAQSSRLQPTQPPREHIEVQRSSDTAREATSAVAELEALPASWRQPTGLKQWRHRRDSLQTLYAELTSPHKGLIETKSRQKLASSDVGQVELLLLYAHYQVARLTQDAGERAAAIGFLSDYTRQEDSRFKAEAESYLQALKGRQTD